MATNQHKYADLIKLWQEMGKSPTEALLALIQMLDGELPEEAEKFLQDNPSDIVESIKEDVEHVHQSKDELERELMSLFPTYLDGFRHYNEKSKRYTPAYDEFAKYMKHRYNYFATENANYWWVDGYYQSIEATEFTNILKKETKDYATPTQFDHFRKNTRAMNYKKSVEFNPPGFLNLSNGVLDIKKEKLFPHSPKFMFNYKLHQDYDKTADCPTFKTWLTQQTGDEANVFLFFEFLGYILEGGKQTRQRIFVATGEKDTGKSSICKITERFLGSENCSSVDLDQLNDRFKPIGMLGKLANISDEIPDKAINSEKFKKITAGGKITIEQKGQPVFSTSINAKFMASANGFVKFDSSRHTEALMKRLLYVPFVKPIAPDQIKDNFEETFDAEFPGMLNQALIGLKRLKMNNKFTIAQKTLELMREAHMEQDPVMEYLEEYLELDNHQGRTVQLSVLYDSFKITCADNNRKACHKREFFERVKRWAKDKEKSDPVVFANILTNHSNKWCLKYVKSYAKQNIVVSFPAHIG